MTLVIGGRKLNRCTTMRVECGANDPVATAPGSDRDKVESSDWGSASLPRAVLYFYFATCEISPVVSYQHTITLLLDSLAMLLKSE